MPVFSKRSAERLLECHPDLQAVMNEAIKDFDFAILCGFRGEKEQEEAFKGGFSKARFGQSPHNFKPSFAVDIAPWPIDWNNIERFKQLGEHIKNTAFRLKIDIEWGGDWKKFKDYPHFEIKGWKK